MKESRIRVLIVDNGELHRPLSELLRRQGMEVQEAEEAAAALNLIRLQSPDVLLLDADLPNTNGIEILRRARELDGDLPVVIVTASADLRKVIEAVKVGAYEYLRKPFENSEVISTIRKAWVEHRRKRHSQQADEEAENKWSLPQRMGASEKVRRLAAEVALVAATNFSVVIVGETGVGKELVARAIHTQSHRAAAQFLAVDCGAIPDSLIENELFGHARGAFTGADRTEIGKFEAASGGTLFLDEISNLPIGMQSKLLRVLQEKRVYRIGSTVGIKVDARVIAASNQDLRSLVLAKSFREDLFHRVSEYILQVPPLRERREDIIFLAKRFLNCTGQELGKEVQGFSESALQLMLTYDWPGNVRELRNVVRRAVLLADEVIGPEQLGLRASPGMVAPTDTESRGDDQLSLKEIVRGNTIQVERTVLMQVLQHTGGNKAKAARLLGIDYKTMHTKMRQYGIGKAINYDATKK